MNKTKKIVFGILLCTIFAVLCLIIVKLYKPSIITPCTFTRTYQVLNATESDDSNYIFVTVKQNNIDDIETVKLSKQLYSSYIEDNYYEFTFELNGSSKDNIESIFSNSKVLTIKESTKDINNQVEDSICK